MRRAKRIWTLRESLTIMGIRDVFWCVYYVILKRAAWALFCRNMYHTASLLHPSVFVSVCPHRLLSGCLGRGGSAYTLPKAGRRSRQARFRSSLSLAN